MSGQYQAFDSKDVRVTTRRQIAYHTGLLFGVVFLTVGGMLLVAGRARYPTWWSLVIGAAGLVPGGYFGLRVYRLSHVVWLVKLFEDRIEGFDYARRKMALGWSAVRRVEFQHDHSILLAGENGTTIRVPASFDEFPALSHAIFAKLNPAAVSVRINGRGLNELSVRTLFPEAEGDEPATY